MRKRIVSIIKKSYQGFINAHSEKIFCIGRNKTGTTSMDRLFRNLGYRVAPQRPAELMLKNWANDELDEIIRFARYRGQVFQDVPFSLPRTYVHLEKAFPKAKFILMIRDSPEIWYESLVNAYSRRFGNWNIPTRQDLLAATYIYAGYMWETIQLTYNTPEEDPLNKEILINHYIKHNADIIEYFADKRSKLLVINLRDADTGKKIADFIGSEVIPEIPWENKFTPDV